MSAITKYYYFLLNHLVCRRKDKLSHLNNMKNVLIHLKQIMITSLMPNKCHHVQVLCFSVCCINIIFFLRPFLYLF